jgi:hypothetical protein
MALASREALPETRHRLEALLASGESAPEGNQYFATIQASKLLPEKAAADFYVTQVQKPSVAEAQFIRGDERLRPFTKAVQKLIPADVFPRYTY